MPEHNRYSRELLTSTAVVTVVALAVSIVLMLVLYSAKEQFLWDLTSESAAVWLSLPFGLAVSLAGAWVAIRIAEAAKAAQDHSNILQAHAIDLQKMANSLQEQAIKLEDSYYARAREILIHRNELIAHLNALTTHVVTAINYRDAFKKKVAQSLRKELEETGEVYFIRNDERFVLKRGNLNEQKTKETIEAQAVFEASDHYTISMNAFLKYVEPEIIRLLSSLTPIVLSDCKAVEDKTGLGTKWLKALSGLTYGMATLPNVFHTEKGLGNIYASVDDLMNALRKDEFGDVNYVYRLITDFGSSIALPSEVEASFIETRNKVYETFGRPNNTEGSLEQ